MKNIIDAIHKERMIFAHKTGMNGTIVILGYSLLCELRHEAYTDNLTVFREAIKDGDDPSIFGMRIVVSNDNDKISIAWETIK